MSIESLTEHPKELNSHSLPRELLEVTSIDAIEWSIRARNCLQRAGCRNLWDVASRSLEDWMQIRNLGFKTLREIKDKLSAFGAQRAQPRSSVDEGDMKLSTLERELLGLANDPDPRGISAAAWAKLVDDLRRNSKGDEPIGDVAARLGVKWPANRYSESLAGLLFADLALLWSQGGLGKTKVRVIIQCALSIWVQWRGMKTAASGSRAEILAEIANGLRTASLASAMEAAFAAAGVNEKEREILVQRYGILDGQPRTLESVGELYGVTRERIRQIQEKGRKKLNRPPDLREVLENGFRRLESSLFKRLNSGVEGFIVEQSQTELLGSLGGWEGLLIELFYESVEEWLNERAERTQIGWVHGVVTATGVEESKTKLAPYLQTCGIPVPVVIACRETALPESLVRIAALHGAGWLSGEFVSARWLRAKEQRVLRVHVQTRHYSSPVLKRKALPDLFHPGMPENSFSPSTFSHEVGCFPQLMLRCGSEYVLRVTAPWEISYPDLHPTPPPPVFNARNEEEASESDRDDDASLYDFGFRLLKTRKLWRTSDLMNEFVRASHGRYSAACVGQLTVSHPGVQRFAPGFWGAKDTVLTEDDYQALLTNDDCGRYIEARWAKADMTPFPMWNPGMELRWCRWAKDHAPEDIFQSLLSVIAPDQWNCALPLREQWKQRQRANGRYRLARPPRKSLAQMPVVADELLAAVGAVVGRGGTSWMDLNILHGRTIDSHRPAPFLALLIALGAVEPSKHWQEHHPSTQAASGIFHQLCKLWIQSPSGKGQPLLDFVRAAAEPYLRKDDGLSWVSHAELQSLLSVLGKAEMLADEWEVSD